MINRKKIPYLNILGVKTNLKENLMTTIYNKVENFEFVVSILIYLDNILSFYIVKKISRILYSTFYLNFIFNFLIKYNNLLFLLYLLSSNYDISSLNLITYKISITKELF